MKTSKVVFSFSLLLSCLCIATTASAAKSPLVRYHPAEGQTNIYKVDIEVRDESGTQGLTGNIFLIPKSVTSNCITLYCRGSLSPKRERDMQPYYGGPGRMRWMSPISLNDAVEVQVDNQGHFLRVMGDSPLPIPLGSVAQLLVPQFPAGAESRWDTSDEMAVLDEPLNVGPALTFMNQSPGMSTPYYGGYYDYRRGPGALAVTRKIHCEAKADGTQLTVSNRVALVSRAQFGAEPRISANCDGEFVVDRESGLLRRADSQFKAVSSNDTVTRRTSGSVHIKLLQGKEREDILEAAASQPGYGGFPNQPARKLSSDEVQKLLSDIKSDNENTRTTAANKLQSADLTDVPAATLSVMNDLLNDQNMSVRMAAARIVADYGTAEQVPALIKLLKSSDTSSRWAAIRGLGRLKDKRAAEPLASLLARGSSDGYQVAEALGKIGSDAEDPVLALLKEKNTDTLRQACNVLKQIGTQKSVPALRELMLDADQSVNSSAAEAVRAITSRE